MANLALELAILDLVFAPRGLIYDGEWAGAFLGTTAIECRPEGESEAEREGCDH